MKKNKRAEMTRGKDVCVGGGMCRGACPGVADLQLHGWGGGGGGSSQPASEESGGQGYS